MPRRPASDAAPVAPTREFAASYETLSDGRAKSTANRWLAIREQHLKLKSKYLERYAKVLRGSKMARAPQIENKPDALIGVNLA